MVRITLDLYGEVNLIKMMVAAQINYLTGMITTSVPQHTTVGLNFLNQ